VNTIKIEKQTSLKMVDPSMFLDQVSSNELIAYSDDPLGDLLFGANGLVIAGILATVAAVGLGFVSIFFLNSCSMGF